jgi:hypothetical protein
MISWLRETHIGKDIFAMQYTLQKEKALETIHATLSHSIVPPKGCSPRIV